MRPWLIVGLCVAGLTWLAAAGYTRPVVRIDAAAARAVFGHAVALDGTTVRLGAIVSPDAGHPAHPAARRHLDHLIRGAQSLECRIARRPDRHGRRHGHCIAVQRDGGRVDLQRAMIEAGLARSCLGWGLYRYVLYENGTSLALPFPGFCRSG